MTPSDVWHASFRCVTWLIQMCDRTHSDVWQDSFRCVTWLIQMSDRTHSDVWQDSFRCVTGLIQIRETTRSYVWQDILVCVTCRIDIRDISIRDIPHSYVCLIHMSVSFRCVAQPIHSYKTRPFHLHKCALLIFYETFLSRHIWTNDLTCHEPPYK